MQCTLHAYSYRNAFLGTKYSVYQLFDPKLHDASKTVKPASTARHDTALPALIYILRQLIIALFASKCPLTRPPGFVHALMIVHEVSSLPLNNGGSRDLIEMFCAGVPVHNIVCPVD